VTQSGNSVVFDELPIPEGKSEIWIIGGGPSLDLLDKSTIDRSKAIVITQNGTIQYLKPDYHVCNDTHAVYRWSKHKWAKDCIWIDRYDRAKIMDECGVKHVLATNLYERTYTGTGAEAVNLAYWIWYNHREIQAVHYVGMDCSEVILPNQRTKHPIQDMGWNKTHRRIVDAVGKCHYVYPACLPVFPYQKPIQLPKGWQEREHRIEWSVNQCYRAQLISIARIAKGDQRFGNLLQSHSFLDFNRLNPARRDAGYQGARRNVDRPSPVQAGK
jgi:hypothetical protein